MQSPQQPLTAIAIAAGLCALLARDAGAQTNWVTTGFKPAGMTSMQPLGLNDLGEIIGNINFGSGQYGFVYRNGAYEPLPAMPGAWNTGANDISGSGAVVGTAIFGIPSDSNSWTYQPYVQQGGVFTPLALGIPATARPEVRGISENGRYVSGWYATPGNRSVGFVFDRQTNAVAGTIDPGNQNSILAAGVNNAGQVVGNYAVGNNRIGFVYDLASGTRTDFTFSGLSFVSPRGINDSGQIAGWAYTGSTASTSVAWVGNTQSYTIVSGPTNGLGALGTAINNPGQVLGYYLTANGSIATEAGGFFATQAALPVGPGPDPYSHAFDLAVQADVPVFIDPLVAVGYRYRTGIGDPNFKTVSLPLGVGDNFYEIAIGGQRFTVAGNQIFDFTTNGFAGGVAEFTVNGIEPEALLDPSGQGQFVTRLTFAGSGRFTGTQTAITANFTPPIPEPGTWALMALGLAALLPLRKVRKREA